MLRLTEVQTGMAQWLNSVDEDRPTILGRLMNIETKIDRILEQKEREDDS